MNDQINNEDIKEVLSYIHSHKLSMYADRISNNSHIESYLNLMTNSMCKIAKLLFNPNMDNAHDVEKVIKDYMLWKKSIGLIENIILNKIKSINKLTL